MTNNEPITLKVGNSDRLDHLTEEICEALTKNEISDLAVAPYNIYKERGVKVIDKKGKEVHTELLAHFMKKRYSCTKNELAEVLALGLCSMDNLETLLDACPFSGARELLTMALKNPYVSNDDIAKEFSTHRMAFTSIICNGWFNSYACSVPFFTLDKGGYGGGHRNDSLPYVRLAVKRPFRNILRSEYLKVERPKPVQVLPSTSSGQAQYRLFTSGGELELRFAMFATEEKLGHFDYNDKGLLAPSLRTTAAAMQLTEFFPDAKDTHLKQMRARMALSLMAQARHYKSSRTNNFAHQMIGFESTVKDSQLARLLIFRHIKGFNANVANSCRDKQIYEWLMGELQAIFRESSAGWLSLSDITESLYAAGLSEYVMNFLSFDSYRGYWGRATLDNKFTGDSDCNLQKERFFTIPYVRGLFFLLASVGYFDLAFDDSITPDASPYDTLAYIRPTALGLYLLGLSPHYEGIKMEERQWFEADEKYLIVRSLAEPNPYLPLIATMASPIGGGRMAFTAKTMLQGVSTPTELQNRIDLFRDYVTKTPPEVWTRFFAQLKRRCQPFKALSSAGFRIMQLRADSDPGLLRLLSPDTPVGRLCIRAEGFRLLVPTENYSEFERLLRAEGYMI